MLLCISINSKPVLEIFENTFLNVLLSNPGNLIMVDCFPIKRTIIVVTIYKKDVKCYQSTSFKEPFNCCSKVRKSPFYTRFDSHHQETRAHQQHFLAQEFFKNSCKLLFKIEENAQLRENLGKCK